MTPDISALAAATHAAMIAPPPFVDLANALLIAATRGERAALMDAADDATRNDALAYLAEPDAARERNRRLAWMRADPRRAPMLRHYYAQHIATFIDDWGTTLDPRLLSRGGSAIIPFHLFPKQVDMVDFMLARFHGNESGVILKARDCGASWCAMSMLCALCLFNDNFAAIIGSALEVKIDQTGVPGTLMAKARMFLNGLPEEFRGGWSGDKHSAHMRLWFPNGSSIQGQAGLQIGRGERAAIVVCDEWAFVEHADTVDASLAATSDVKLYISSVNGPDNNFAVRARNDAIPRFVYSWRDDPRKASDPGWKERKVAADGLRKFQQEYECDFLAGTAGQLIPREHVEACIDAHLKLAIKNTGRRYAGFDVGNGGDPSAFAVVHGCVVEHVEAWPSGTNLMAELRKAFGLADKYELTEFCADAVGIGAGIEGDAQQINAEREAKGLRKIRVVPFKGSEAALFPKRPAVPGSSYRTEDYYLNRKAQAYDWLRYRAALTHRAVNGDPPKDTDNLLFISSKVPDMGQLLMELGQITAEQTVGGKLKIDKYGDGFSPNRADALVMAAAPRVRPMNITDEVLDNSARPPSFHEVYAASMI